MSEPSSDDKTQANHDMNSKSCHWMPCSVATDGVAAVNLYFQPKSKTVTSSESTTNTNSSNSVTDSVSIQSATFRGRGLLAAQPTELPCDVNGYVISMDGTKNQAAVRGSFRYLHEWEHEWNENEFAQKSRSVTEQSRGLEYLEIMKALHEPIPIHPSEQS